MFDYLFIFKNLFSTSCKSVSMQPPIIAHYIGIPINYYKKSWEYIIVTISYDIMIFLKKIIIINLNGFSKFRNIEYNLNFTPLTYGAPTIPSSILLAPRWSLEELDARF